MTSTNFNIGLDTSARNSSKVLKPPGGGSSDIFGVGAAEPAEPQRRTKNHSHLSSSIFGEDNSTPARNKAESNSAGGEGDKAEAPSVNGSQSSTASSAAPTPSAPPTAGRQRVPPGGFSSGLW